MTIATAAIEPEQQTDHRRSASSEKVDEVLEKVHASLAASRLLGGVWNVQKRRRGPVPEAFRVFFPSR